MISSIVPRHQRGFRATKSFLSSTVPLPVRSLVPTGTRPPSLNSLYVRSCSLTEVIKYCSLVYHILVAKDKISRLIALGFATNQQFHPQTSVIDKRLESVLLMKLANTCYEGTILIPGFVPVFWHPDGENSRVCAFTGTCLQELTAPCQYRPE